MDRPCIVDRPFMYAGSESHRLVTETGTGSRHANYPTTQRAHVQGGGLLRNPEAGGGPMLGGVKSALPEAEGMSCVMRRPGHVWGEGRDKSSGNRGAEEIAAKVASWDIVLHSLLPGSSTSNQLRNPHVVPVASAYDCQWS